MSKALGGLRLALAIAFTALVMAALVSFAARNSAGTYSLANGPYTPGTVINSAAVNSEFADLGTEITSSLDRSGRGGMLAPLRGVDGTVAAPAHSYTSETNSGLYRIGASDHGFAVAGVKTHEWTATGETVTGTMAVSGASTLTGNVGIGGAPTNIFDVAVSGSATTTFGNWLEASLADGSTLAINFGKSTSAGGSGLMVYTKNATAANSTYCLGVAGGSASSLCVDGNDKVLSHSLTIGSSGTAITASNAGTVSWTPGNLLTQTCAANTITVTGAATGSPCALGPPSLSVTGIVATCAITGSGTCVVNVCNPTTITQTAPAGTWSCRAFNP